MTIRLTKEQKIKILNSRDIYTIMQAVLKREKKIDRNKEHVWVVCMATNHRILLIELVSLGTMNRAVADPVDIFSLALQKQAARIIIVHNHPSGELIPSHSDAELTDRMMAIGKFVNVPVVDHLIISEDNYFSFADSGLLKQLEKETTYDLNFTEIKKLKTEISKKGLTIATALLTRGIDPVIVAESTGLSKRVVSNLQKALQKGSKEKVTPRSKIPKGKKK